VITAGAYRAPVGATHGFGAEYDGDVFLSDYYSGNFWRIERSGNTWSLAAPVDGQPDATHWAILPTTISDYAIAPDGALWYCRQYINFNSGTGQIRRIAPRSGTSPPPPPPPAFTIGSLHPSPTAGEVRFDITLERASEVSAVVVDARGRRVRELEPGRTWSSGTATLLWNGLDDGGREAPSGLYFIRVTVNGRGFVRRAVVVR
jgi:hypothetical protein